MKYLIYICAIILSCSPFLWGQSLGCLTNDTVTVIWADYDSLVGFPKGPELSPYNPDHANAERYTVGLALHIIADDNGNSSVDDSILTADLNLLFATFSDHIKIDFFVAHRDTIFDDNLVSTDEEEEEAIADLRNINGFVNIYYIPEPSRGNGRATYSPDKQSWFNMSTGCTFAGQYIIISNDRDYETTLTHEMGHYFDLFHTYEYILNHPDKSSEYEIGDLIPDTPFSAAQAARDCNSSDPDEIILSRNFMSTSAFSEDCRSEFTPIQKRYMRYALAERRDDHILTLKVVRLTNSINTLNAGGMLQATQATNAQVISSGQTVGLNLNDNVEFRTLNERFIISSPSITAYKHYRWNNETDNYLLTNDKFVTEGLQDQSAQFVKLDTVLINLRSISGGDLQNFSLEFYDPWYVDENGSQIGDTIVVTEFPFLPKGSANAPVGSGGFLNQPIISGRPYYSVKVPVQPSNGIDSFIFLGWDGINVSFETPLTDITGVVFNAPNAVAEARYKTHLGSSNGNVTEGNNSRRIVKAGNNSLHIVYADDTDIWYTYSTNSGEDWSNEIRISNSGANDTALAPSITEKDNMLHIVYLSNVGGGFGYYEYEVMYTTKPLSGSGWSAPVNIDDNYAAWQQSIPYPTIAAWHKQVGNTAEEYVTIALADDLSGYIFSWERKRTDPVDDWSDPVTFSGDMPALAAIQRDMDIVYRDGSDLYIRRWNTGSDSWGSARNVTADISATDFRNPSMSLIPAAGNTWAFITWEQINSNDRKIAYRRFHWPNSSKSDVTYFSSKDSTKLPSHPTISAWGDYIHEANNFATIVYEQDNKIIKKIEKPNQKWQGKNMGAGSNPLIAVNDHTGKFYEDAGMVYTGSNSAPYKVKTDFLGFSSGPPPPNKMGTTKEAPRDPESSMRLILAPLDSMVVYKRLDVAVPEDNSDESLVSVAIKDIFAGTTHINLDWELQSDQMVVDPNNLTLYFNVGCQFNYTETAADSTDIIWELKFHENDNPGVSLAQLIYADLLHYNDGEVHHFPISIDLSSLANLEGTFVFHLSGLPAEVSDVVVPVDSISTETLRAGKGKLGKPGLIVDIPKQFDLKPNYPNPFNPSTTIAYDLPKTEQVTIRIYDIRGSLVKTLLSSYQDAGRYQVIWDSNDEHGNNVASGVYLYRMAAGEFVKTRKMVLMR